MLAISKEVCMLPPQMYFYLIISLLLSLKALIFCPSRAIGPSVHGTCVMIAIACMESGIDFGLDKMTGCRGDSVFQRCNFAMKSPLFTRF